MTSALEVVAVAARTPLGLTAESTAAAVRAAITGFREFPFIMTTGEPVVTCADSQLEPIVEGRDRLVPMIGSVLGEIGEDDRRRIAISRPVLRPARPARGAAGIL